jgi:hypothetical protein
VDAQCRAVDEIAQKYVALARSLGWNFACCTGEGLDPLHEAAQLCIELSREYPCVVFFAGKLIWKRKTWMQRILHNETAYGVAPLRDVDFA